MEITKVHDITFDTNDSIITATPSAVNEVVMLLSSGDVIRFNLAERKGEGLFSVKNRFSHEDGGFDIDAKSTIYTLDSIVVIVNDYKRHGFVHYPDKYKNLHLWRGDYHSNHSTFPIALFKDDMGIPHLIYGEDWNHVQIMNLETRQILTAAKSRIEEYAEENHLRFYKNHYEEVKTAWPRPYDYFYGRLAMSPNQKRFLSAGWVWGSVDAYTVYEVDQFIESNRISYTTTGGWEHDERATCWIDDQTIAIAYDPIREGDEGANSDSPNELHFYTVKKEPWEIKNKIRVEGLNLVNSTISHNKTLDVFVVCSDDEGVAVLSMEGDIIWKDDQFKPASYHADFNRFIKTKGKTVTLYELTNTI